MARTAVTGATQPKAHSVYPMRVLSCDVVPVMPGESKVKSTEVAKVEGVFEHDFRLVRALVTVGG